MQGILNIIDYVSSMSRNALISSWNKVPGFQPTANSLNVDEDEEKLIKLDLSQLEERVDQQIGVSDDDNELNPPRIK